ncbi:MAG: T9SS type B sorting domain-containing protein [Bacteroidales bacterium]|nr:T9SS type B sorting domain-containing protein [Bacteroidales bacterium]
MTFKHLYIFLSVIFFSNVSFGQLYTEYSSPTSLDSMVLRMFSSPNVHIYNISFTGDYNSYTNEIYDIGYFNSLNSTVGIDSGIVLTGGWLEPPFGLGKPSYNETNYWKFTPGDAILDSIIYPSTTLGAAVLEFDFVPIGDTLKFNYVFASDEYPNQICHIDNDVFAFHVSGPGISGIKNIALIPNTSIPVGNNSINDTSFAVYSIFINSGNCQSLDYPQYYVDHGQDSVFIFNGSTTVLTAKVATIPCETYHLRFAIANGGDDTDESPAVFLEANSFNSEPLKIIPSVLYGGFIDSLLYEGCGFAKLIFRRTYNIQQPKTYNLIISGTAQNGVDYSGIPNQITFSAGQMYDTLTITPVFDNLPDDNETIIVTIGDTLCNGDFYETQAIIKISETHNPKLTIVPDSGLYCDTVIFKSNITGGFSPYTFSWNNGQGTDSIFHFYSEGMQTITLNIVDACGSSIHETISIDFKDFLIADFSYLPDSVSMLNPEVNFTNLSSNNAINWFWHFENSVINTENPIYTFQLPGSYSVKLIIENEFGCKESITKLINVYDYGDIDFPNVFTPNDDGINDAWYIKVKAVNITELKIFNRWGKCVYKCENDNCIWNGGIMNNKDRKASPGVYYFIVNYEDYKGNHTTTGFIHLFRE